MDRPRSGNSDNLVVEKLGSGSSIVRVLRRGWITGSGSDVQISSGKCLETASGIEKTTRYVQSKNKASRSMLGMCNAFMNDGSALSAPKGTEKLVKCSRKDVTDGQILKAEGANT